VLPCAVHCVLRAVHRVSDLTRIAVIFFEFECSAVVFEVNVFVVRVFSGVVTESEEMAPQWFRVAAVPYARMWLDDAVWFPHMFAGHQLRAFFLFRGHNQIVEQTVELWKGPHSKPADTNAATDAADSKQTATAAPAAVSAASASPAGSGSSSAAAGGGPVGEHLVEWMTAIWPSIVARDRSKQPPVTA
jgi:hypothetical protein